MIHPNVSPESGNGPASDPLAAPSEPGHAPRAEGGDSGRAASAPSLPEPGGSVSDSRGASTPDSSAKAKSDDSSASQSESPAPRDLAAPAAPPPEPDRDPAPRAAKESAPVDAMRRMESRIRRLEKAVMALVKHQRASARTRPVPVAQAALVEVKVPVAPSIPQSPDVELPPVAALAPPVAPPPPGAAVVSLPMAPPLPPAIAPEPLIPLIAPAPPPAELSTPPVAIIAPELPVASLAMPPVAALVPPGPISPSSAGTPSLRDRIVAAGQRVMSSPVAGQAMAAAAVPMARAAIALASASAGTSTHPFRHPWIAMEAYHELRGVIRMYMDRSYRPGLYAWLIPVFALSLMICSYFFVSGMPLIGPVLDKLIDLGLAYVAYKAMVREAERYELQRTNRVPA